MGEILVPASQGSFEDGKSIRTVRTVPVTQQVLISAGAVFILFPAGWLDGGGGVDTAGPPSPPGPCCAHRSLAAKGNQAQAPPAFSRQTPCLSQGREFKETDESLPSVTFPRLP